MMKSTKVDANDDNKHDLSMSVNNYDDIFWMTKVTMVMLMIV